MRNIKEKAAGFFSLPKEVALDLPLVMATGRGEVNIENYKNLLEFSDTRIRVHTKEGMMTVEGEQLRLRQVTTENVLVSGMISGILYT
ncbi:MAG: YabP/YqfC family sporulation protein [Clostridiales bacterium]|jgi:sporulation protein YqfC|nr:YabP/YqfC family sporulation protein [Clostridiales bacterium]